ncbi:MAG: hypothetical protein M0P13_03515 [Fibrobacteraceae bacterium]|nr:hypothetical protein [Fibrobacteraceae bacterium]
MYKVTAALLEKLIALSNGECLPGSRLNGELAEDLLREGVLVNRSHKSRVLFYAPEGKALREYLATRDDAFKNLEGSLQVIQRASDISRAEQVDISGNSKIRSSRSCKGFLINSYDCINAKLDGSSFEINPPCGSYLFVADYERFFLPENVVVVGVENMENFRYVARQRYLFESLKVPVLFVARYPQSGDLIRWLKMIPNLYIHFGDLDLAGIHIYLTEFYAMLGERASFFIPEDAEARIMNGSEKRYNDQIEKFEKMIVADLRVEPLAALIRKYHRGYDQEGFIEF